MLNFNFLKYKTPQNSPYICPMNITCTWPKKPYLWCAVCAILASCNTPEQPSAAHSAQPLVQPKPTAAAAPLFEANAATEMGRFINCIVQDKSNNYWFGTNDAGVYRCDANRQHLIQFTEKDGLSSNQSMIDIYKYVLYDRYKIQQ